MSGEVGDREKVDVQRWTSGRDVPGGIEQDPNGAWVRFEDYVGALSAPSPRLPVDLERIASDIGIKVSELIERAELESAPEVLWHRDQDQTQGEEDAWLKGRDDTGQMIRGELEGFIRQGLELAGLAASPQQEINEEAFEAGAEAMARKEYELYQEEMGHETVWEEETQGHRNIYLDAARERFRLGLEAALKPPASQQPFGKHLSLGSDGDKSAITPASPQPPTSNYLKQGLKEGGSLEITEEMVTASAKATYKLVEGGAGAWVPWESMSQSERRYWLDGARVGLEAASSSTEKPGGS
jgi:hypothetical protein